MAGLATLADSAVFCLFAGYDSESSSGEVVKINKKPTSSCILSTFDYDEDRQQVLYTFPGYDTDDPLLKKHPLPALLTQPIDLAADFHDTLDNIHSESPDHRAEIASRASKTKRGRKKRPSKKNSSKRPKIDNC